MLHSMKFVPLALAALAFGLPATAAAGGAALSGLRNGGPLTAPGAAAMVSTLDVNVTGVVSVDGEGSALNQVLTFNVGAGTLVTGIGWDVSVSTVGASWLSEMVVSFGGTSASAVNLTVGIDDEFPGSAAYSSGGVVDLGGLGLTFTVGGDGILRLEFFESFDDVEGEVDGLWNAGTISIQVSAVPEPASYGLMALGLFGVGALARRRRG